MVLRKKSLSPEQELVSDILSILHCFSARLYGLRKYEKPARKELQKETPSSDKQDDSEQLEEGEIVSLSRITRCLETLVSCLSVDL
ncbi:conserved protein of unknown function [Limnospira indica PCC 8005]|uniref:Uncharacterized protein n=1 Tax=Limnospira indica PCC 8005 TaxID=376219 RepID=A0A9P1P1D9_9CYAN|nr:conserved protein of unknown function [Limnospira indica PCC 8005]